ncbi:uncharacterized protein YcnI [Glaciihabitans tibetensis]|uniref:Uncharacterized protein YcnI n=1 Tax=Glaciihabitans tibetensis TaxID=1266600 RepID=A0A2T0VIP3_9MICO|nr:YcnI family protein [Glaciihabitans tibetensis]PRY70106.1 uncharacterized protein YcnI [Glaciihabitans tibetensis]
MNISPSHHTSVARSSTRHPGTQRRSASAFAKGAAAIGAGALLALAAPLAASAHVTINPNAAEAGSYAVITVKVPNESATATTTKVELALPEDTPFTSVRYVPVAGWSAELVSETLPAPVTVGENEVAEAVTSVVWTALPGSEIADGQLQQFSVSLGAVPDTGSVVLPATQYYSDGTIVSWDSTEEDAEYPAPVLYINDAAPTDHHAAAGADHDEDADADADAATASNGSTASSVSSGDDVLARILGLGGLLLGAAGLVLGITARRRNAE